MARRRSGTFSARASPTCSSAAHCAPDWEAACAGDALSELRARLNRAIALMSSDRPDEARTMLTSVLADGEAQGQIRAVSFALANLSIIAMRKYEYWDALSLLSLIHISEPTRPY